MKRVIGLVMVMAVLAVGCNKSTSEKPWPESEEKVVRTQFQCGALTYNGPEPIPTSVWDLCLEIIKRDHERAKAALKK